MPRTGRMRCEAYARSPFFMAASADLLSDQTTIRLPAIVFLKEHKPDTQMKKTNVRNVRSPPLIYPRAERDAEQFQRHDAIVTPEVE